MQNLRELSDDVLLAITVELVSREREITLSVLHHLREVERRSLYAARGYSSLFEYAVKELKYSEGSAYRRISSMRLLKEIPELEEKIEKGLIGLSVLAQAQKFFRQEKTQVSGKREILTLLEGKSAREVERTLEARASVRSVSEDVVMVSVPRKILEQIEELKRFVPHGFEKMPPARVIEILVADGMKKYMSRTAESRTAESRTEGKSAPRVPGPPAAEKKPATSFPTLETEPKRSSRYIPTATRRVVQTRDGGRCTYVDGVTGRRCEATHGLEFDHIRPVAHGGKATPDNLRLTCRAHNLLWAVRNLGRARMSPYVSRLDG